MTTAEATATTKQQHAPGVVKRTSAYNVDPRTVTRRPGWNPRFDFGEIDALSASLVANGMLNPIRVQRIAEPTEDEKLAGHLFYLIDGDRRLTAIELLIKKGKYDAAFPDGIPAMIVSKDQDDRTSYLQTFAATDAKSFLPLEEAAAFKRMRDEFGMTIKEIEKATGRSDNTINSALALLEAPEELQAAVRDGKVNQNLAKEIAVHARGDKAKQKELTEKAVSAGKDKTKKRAVKAEIEKTRRAKHATKGRTLKMRALTNAQLSDLGATVSVALAAQLEAMGIGADKDLVKMIGKNPEQVMAYSVGVLEGLKIAAGAESKAVLKLIGA